MSRSFGSTGYLIFEFFNEALEADELEFELIFLHFTERRLTLQANDTHRYFASFHLGEL